MPDHEFIEDEPTALEIAGTQTIMPCPRCGEKMIGVKYNATLKILQERSWNTCVECGYEIDIAKWKRSILTV